MAGSKAREDSIGRFERVIDTQITAFSEIDSKAEHIMKFVGVVIGVIISGISLSIENGASFSNFLLPVKLIFYGGSLLLFISMIAAVITYFRSKFRYGLHHSVADFLADEDLKEEEYNELLLRAYGDAVKFNRNVIEKNNYPLGVSLISLFLGLFWIFAALTIKIWNTNSCVAWSCVTIIFFTSLWTFYYVSEGNYEIGELND